MSTLGGYSGFHNSLSDYRAARGSATDLSSDLYRPAALIDQAEEEVGKILNDAPHVILTGTSESACALALSVVPVGGEMIVGYGVPRDIVTHTRERTGVQITWIEPSLRGVTRGFSDSVRTIFLPDVQLLLDVHDLRLEWKEIVEYLERKRFRGNLVVYNSMAPIWMALAAASFRTIAIVPMYRFWFQDDAFGGALASVHDLSDLRRTQLVTGCHFLAPTSTLSLQKRSIHQQCYARAIHALELAKALQTNGQARGFSVGGTFQSPGSMVVTLWSSSLDYGKLEDALDRLGHRRAAAVSDLVGHRFTAIRPLERVDFPNSVSPIPVGLRIAIGNPQAYKDDNLKQCIVDAVQEMTTRSWI